MPSWKDCARASTRTGWGRPSPASLGGISRLLFIGYFEGLSSERGESCGRVADSLSLRAFPGSARDGGAAEPLDTVTHAASDRR